MRFSVTVSFNAAGELGDKQNWLDLRDEIQQEIEAQINEKLVGRGQIAFLKPVSVKVSVQ